VLLDRFIVQFSSNALNDFLSPRLVTEGYKRYITLHEEFLAWYVRCISQETVRCSVFLPTPN